MNNSMTHLGGIPMRLTQLEYFLAAAKHEHITQAAQELFISQPALTRQIRELEQELDVPLFQKNGRSIELTNYGTSFQKTVAESLALLNQGVQQLHKQKALKEQQLMLHIDVASLWTADLIQTFQQSYPDVSLHIQHYADRSDTIDYWLTSNPYPEFPHQKLFQEPLVIALNKTYAHKYKDINSIYDLNTLQLVTLTEQKPLRQQLNQLLNQYKIRPQIIYECDHPHILKELLHHQEVATLFPLLSWQSLNQKLLLYPLKERLCRSIYLMWHPDMNSHPNHLQIVQLFKNFYQQKATATYEYILQEALILNKNKLSANTSAAPPGLSCFI